MLNIPKHRTVFTLTIFLTLLLVSAPCFPAAISLSHSMENTLNPPLQQNTILQDLTKHIDPENAATLMLILHNLNQKTPHILTTLHDCARAETQQNIENDQDHIVKACKASLTTYTDLCLKQYSALFCAETAAVLMLHGTTSLEPLPLP